MMRSRRDELAARLRVFESPPIFTFSGPNCVLGLRTRAGHPFSWRAAWLWTPRRQAGLDDRQVEGACWRPLRPNEAL